MAIRFLATQRRNPPRRSAMLLLALLATLGLGGAVHAQPPGAAPPPGSPPEHGVARPPLFFREEWKQSGKGGEHPVSPESVANPNLQMQLLVPAGQILVTGNQGDENNPPHLWTGLCTSPCGLVLRDTKRVADLTGLARIRWSTHVSGFHAIRPVVRLTDSTWLVGDHADGGVRDWIQSEFSVADVQWLKLDDSRVVTKGTLVEHPDLSKVDAIGFVDLVPASGHGPGGWTDVGVVEVYAKSAPR